ncbi:prolyl oligopeptidase family serine peptidase [Brachybacterium phenoliresistens]|uniref:Peptidase S9 prolyl oligopeptidase catalytic domain-containing protein n=1 Tax=Brachybacterium phenoliresistens TaxID=396014 RepID=Z9JXT0_9MICO|nr:prolyl oligopeptidase family serine peptidase [Brachybacterium phenoliresistens]EWS82577.1 hypothetical protein BF93_05940 [Brachybacterium phenoliresistens]
MRTSLPRRTLLASTAAVGASAALLPAIARAESSGRGQEASFTLTAEVLDGGEQVTSLTLSSPALRPVRRDSLDAGTFSVHVRATNPLTGEVAYEQDRTVTDASWTRRGDVLLELEHGEGVPGGATLGYMVDARRNVVLDLEYTIVQDAPLSGPRGDVVLTSFSQGALEDPEVDAFSSHVSSAGLNYRLFSPKGGRGPGGKGRALVVWLHGGGEGGMAGGAYDYYDNETQLRANRGALGFATPEAQEAFGGAYVLAPQSPSAWMEDGDGFAPMIRETIAEVVEGAAIDVDRIHVVGCSNGGYMSLKMVAEHPELFASSVPICCGIGARDGSDPYYISDEELAAMTTPTWLVHSADDTTLDAQDNTVHAHELIPGSIMSLYDEVVWDGVSFPGHWSWIYVARNDPQHEGVRIWDWMGEQTL